MNSPLTIKKRPVVPGEGRFLSDRSAAERALQRRRAAARWRQGAASRCRRCGAMLERSHTGGEEQRACSDACRAAVSEHLPVLAGRVRLVVELICGEAPAPALLRQEHGPLLVELAAAQLRALSAGCDAQAHGGPVSAAGAGPAPARRDGQPHGDVPGRCRRCAVAIAAHRRTCSDPCRSAVYRNRTRLAAQVGVVLAAWQGRPVDRAVPFAELLVQLTRAARSRRRAEVLAAQLPGSRDPVAAR